MTTSTSSVSCCLYLLLLVPQLLAKEFDPFQIFDDDRNQLLTKENLAFAKVFQEWSEKVGQRELCNGEASEHQRDYIIVWLKPGICNSMVSLTSALYLAVLTERRFVLATNAFSESKSNDYNVEIHDLFQAPRSWGCWPNLSHVHNIENISARSARYSDQRVLLTFKRFPAIHLPPSKRMRTRHKFDFLCTDWLKYLHYRFIELDSYQYFLKPLSFNPNLSRLVDEGMVPNFGQLVRTLLEPAPRILHAIDNYIRNDLEQDKKMYGMQIRTRFLFQENKIPLSRLRKLENFIHCATTDLNSTLFLATDSEWVKKHFQQISRQVKFTKDPLSRSDKTGIESAVTDMWILGMADTIVGTSRSTFGQCASGIYGAKRRMILSKSKAESVNLEEMTCVSSTTGPCIREEVWNTLLEKCPLKNKKSLHRKLTREIRACSGDVYTTKNTRPLAFW